MWNKSCCICPTIARKLGIYLGKILNKFSKSSASVTMLGCFNIFINDFLCFALSRDDASTNFRLCNKQRKVSASKAVKDGFFCSNKIAFNRFSGYFFICSAVVKLKRLSIIEKC